MKIQWNSSPQPKKRKLPFKLNSNPIMDSLHLLKVFDGLKICFDMILFDDENWTWIFVIDESSFSILKQMKSFYSNINFC